MVDAPDVDFNTTATESPYSLTTSELGVHSIQVLYNSHHFPNEQAMSVEVTVEGEREGFKKRKKIILNTGIRPATVTTSSLTATSVIISWSPQPAQFCLPVVEYTVSLTRVNKSDQTLCTQLMDSRLAVNTTDTSMSFTGLEEFSTYTVTVTTTFNVFGSNMDVASDMMFTTPSAGMDTSFNMQQCSYLSSM